MKRTKAEKEIWTSIRKRIDIALDNEIKARIALLDAYGLQEYWRGLVTAPGMKATSISKVAAIFRFTLEEEEKDRQRKLKKESVDKNKKKRRPA